MSFKISSLLAGAASLLLAACADTATLPTGPASAASAVPLGDVSADATGPGPLVSGLATNLCADVWEESRTSGAPVVSYGCHGGANQRFALQPSGAITAYDGALCLDVWGAQADDGDRVVVYTCHGGANQKWTRTAAGELRTAVNGKCLDVWGAQPVDGAKLAVYPCHGGANQKWTVTGGSDSPAPAAPAPAAPTPAAPAPAAPAPDPGGTVAELPRSTVDSRMPAVVGRTWTVAAGGDLQGALHAARPGDEVVIAAGATFVGNYVLPPKSGMTAGQWITVRTSGTLPAEGTRVGPADAPQMPKLLTANEEPALRTEPGAQGWYVAGLEIGASGARSWTYHLVGMGDGNPAVQHTLAQVPSRIVLARSYVHGTATFDVRRCIALNSASSAVVDSYLAECHSNQSESQAILAWNGPGPFKIQNNHIEGGHEVLFFGGQTPGISGLIPSDIEVRGNHITRPMAWRGVWQVKNLFECKSCQRVLIEGNVFENNWADAQAGYALLFQTLSDDNAMPWIQISDVTIRSNIIRNTLSGINLLSRVAYGGALPSQPMSRVTVVNNSIVLNGALGGVTRALQILSDVRSVTFERNTAVEASDAPLNAGVNFDDGGNLGPAAGLRVVGNVFGPMQYSAIMGNSTVGALGTFARYAPDGVFSGNVAVGDFPSRYPGGNYFPATSYDAGLRSLASGSVQLTTPLAYLPSGATVPGVDVAALNGATAGAVR
jgi:hypothetical protein